MMSVRKFFKKKQPLKEQAKVILLPVDKINPSPFQARTIFDEREIKKLAVSILQNGLLQPISVRQTTTDNWQLIAGERRLRACKIAGMLEIPALIYNFEDEQTATLSLLENLQREQLNPFEQAKAIRDLLNMWNCTQEEAAQKLGMAQPTLANKLRLLVLTHAQQKMCIENSLTERHARAVLRVPTIEERTKVIDTIISKQMNVQQTEEYVNEMILINTKPKRRVMVRDVRIFVNTINRAIQMMTASGIPAHAQRSEQKDYIEYLVRIPTHSETLPISKIKDTRKKVIDVNEEALKNTGQNLIEEIEKQVAYIHTAK